MTTKEAKEAIKKADLNWEDFVDWMFGNTVGVDANGETIWYETDVSQFIRSRIEHEHDFNCIEQDVVDLGDDGDGYVAYPVWVCRITDEEVKGVD